MKKNDFKICTVRSKLEKSYITRYPVELLAYFGGHAFDHETSSWDTPLRETLQSQGLGPFRRVWIQGWKGVRFVYPAAP